MKLSATTSPAPDAGYAMHIPDHASDSAITLREIALAKIAALGRAFELSDAERRAVINAFDLLSTPWGGWAAGASPPWANDLSDDGSPFELSVAFGGPRPVLRVLVEPQRDPITSTSNWEAGLGTHRRLEELGVAELSLFTAVAPLLEPLPGGRHRFALWHAAVLAPHGTLFKAYANPAIHGPHRAAAIVEEALGRVGLAHAWKWLAGRVTRADSGAAFNYFSVDLAHPACARVKVYVALPGGRASVERFAEYAGIERDMIPDGLMVGPVEPRARPILVCAAFRVGSARPDLTLHVPVRHYVGDDLEALDRARCLLSRVEADALQRAAMAMAGRPLSAGRGLISYVSIRLCERTEPAGGRHVTAYLAPEIYTIASPRRARVQRKEGDVT